MALNDVKVYSLKSCFFEHFKNRIKDLAQLWDDGQQIIKPTRVPLDDYVIIPSKKQHKDSYKFRKEQLLNRRS